MENKLIPTNHHLSPISIPIPTLCGRIHRGYLGINAFLKWMDVFRRLVRWHSGGESSFSGNNNNERTQQTVLQVLPLNESQENILLATKLGIKIIAEFLQKWAQRNSLIIQLFSLLYIPLHYNLHSRMLPIIWALWGFLCFQRKLLN